MLRRVFLSWAVVSLLTGALVSPVNMLARQRGAYGNLSTTDCSVTAAAHSSASAQSLLYGPEIFMVELGHPIAATRSFSGDALATSTLVIEAGLGASARPDAVTVKLNGRKVVRPSDSVAGVPIVVKVVDLRPTNLLKVKIKGPDGARVAISVLAADAVARVFTNPADPHLARIVSPDGGRVEYFGTRDEAGEPTALTRAEVTLAGGDVFTTDFDASGRVSRVIAPDSTALVFEWLGPDAVDVTAVSADGTAAAHAVLQLPAQLRAADGRDEPPRISPLGRPSRSPEGDSALVRVRVTACSAPVTDATVDVLVTTSAGMLMIPARALEPGVYAAAIPSASLAPVPVDLFCASFGEVTQTICDINSGIGALGVTAFCGQFTPVLNPALCVALYGSLRLACAFGLPGGAEAVCNVVLGTSDDAISGTVTMQARARRPGRPEIISSSQIAPATGPYPDFDLTSDQCSSRFVAFVEGAPGVPGDGITLSGSKFQFQTPLPISSDTGGYTLAVFLDNGSPVPAGIGYTVRPEPPPNPISLIGYGYGLTSATVIVNERAGQLAYFDAGDMAYFPAHPELYGAQPVVFDIDFFDVTNTGTVPVTVSIDALLVTEGRDAAADAVATGLRRRPRAMPTQYHVTRPKS